MRKIIVLLVAVLFLCSFSTLSFAQKAQGKAAKKAASSTEAVKGKIVSVDIAKSTITMIDEKTGAEKTISVNPKIISSLTAGEEVKATVKLATGVAESVKKVAEKKATAKKHNK